ncbi:MAG: hypothetical protein LUH07_06015 [Lachnospiraceae bacterium]|nr:hypothetical protein [Lachnospiraceae bacterium]
MKIERYYYTEEAKLWQIAEKEEKNRKSDLSEEEQEMERNSLEQKALETEAMAEEKQRGKYRIIQQERLEHFQKLAEIALELAEEAPMDITVDTGHFFGQICMSADCFMILASSPAKMRTDLMTLIRETESVSITPKGENGIEMCFVYPFCSEIPRTGGRN